MSGPWTPAFPLTDLPRGGARLFRSEATRIAVFRLQDDDALLAVDDRCPHEGYPLVQGSVSGRVLTCCFHNFKFDLTDGRCLMGDEAVATYGTRVVDGVVELDLTPPDPVVERDRRWRSLRGALGEQKTGQLCRDVVRLLALGEAPAAVALEAAVFDASHAPLGSSHALPLAADVVGWLPRFEGLQAALPLAQLMEVAADDNARRPAHPPVPAEVCEDVVGELRRRVEAEQATGAEAVLRGALAGDRFDLAEAALLSVTADHFLDFGHGLIFVVKAFDLLRATDPRRGGEVLSGLLRSLVNGTREDVLPKWAAWRAEVAAVEERFSEFDGNTGVVADGAAFRSAVVDGRLREALAALTAELDAGASPQAIARELCLAAAERLLRFDPVWDLDSTVQDDWLSVTHVQTFCNAVRHALPRLSGPLRIRWLYQAVRMIEGARPLDRPTPLEVGPVAGTVDELLAAIGHADGPRAVRLAAGLPLPEMEDALVTLAVSDPVTRPIVVAHVVKQTVAAFDDARVCLDRLPVLALVAFLAGPRRERRVARLVGEAVRLVRDGHAPRVRGL